MRGLRTLAPVRSANDQHGAGNRRLRRAVFFVALTAIVVQFAVSAIALIDMGVDYLAAGGNPLEKLHPATYLTALAALMLLLLERPAGSALIRVLREHPALAMFNLLILFCAFYSIVNVGFSGVAIYVESYLSAGMLAIALESTTDRQKRMLANVVIGFCLISIVMSLYEGATQSHIIPYEPLDENGKPMLMDTEDFRGMGLFAHPLNAAGVTSMATFMLLRMKLNGLLKAAIFTAFMIGLLSFGGRAALATTVILVAIGTLFAVLQGLARRNLSLGLLAAIGAAVVILVPLLVVLVTSTGVGDRIIAHAYYDDSAQARSMQWQVLNYLDAHDLLLGVPPTRLDFLKYQIGLGADSTDIENFWLLMFLNLGIIGFIVFLVALAMFLVHLGRTAAHPLGWMLILATILIDSTSNSLGRKSNDLFMMVTCIVAMSAYHGSSVNAAATLPARLFVRLRGAQPDHAHLAGLKP